MGISELRQGGYGRPGRAARVPWHPLGRDLVRRGVISDADAALASLVQRRCDTSLDRILMSEGLAREDDLLAAHARRIAGRRVDEARSRTCRRSKPGSIHARCCGTARWCCATRMANPGS